MGETHTKVDAGRLNFLVRILTPIARVCLKRSIYIQDGIEALKLAFIAASEAELSRSKHEVNISRLSIATGIKETRSSQTLCRGSN